MRVGKALRNCDYAVLIITCSFLAKSWPRQELRILLAREINEHRSIIIPVFHGIDNTELVDEFQLLLDRLRITFRGDLSEVTRLIQAALRTSQNTSSVDNHPKTRTVISQLVTQANYDDDLNFLLSNAENSIDQERLQREIEKEGKMLVLLSAAPAGDSTSDTRLDRKLHLGHLWMMRYIEHLVHLVPKRKIIVAALPAYNYLSDLSDEAERLDFIQRYLRAWCDSLNGIVVVNNISNIVVDEFYEELSPAMSEQLTRAQALFEALSLHIDLSDQGKSELIRWRLGRIDDANSVTLTKTVQKVKKIVKRLGTAADTNVALSLAYLAIFKCADYGLAWLKLVAFLASNSLGKQALILESSKNAYVWKAAEYSAKQFKLGRFPRLAFLKPVTDKEGLPIKGSLTTEYSLSKLKQYLDRDDQEARRHHDELLRKFAFRSFSELKAYVAIKQQTILTQQ
jgi:hypothetical protein